MLYVQGMMEQFFGITTTEGEVRTRLNTQVTHSSPLETELMKQKYKWDSFYLVEDYSSWVRPSRSHFILKGNLVTNKMHKISPHSPNIQ